MWLCSSCHRLRTEFLNLFMFCSCCHCWHLHWSLVQLQHLLWTHYWKWAPGCLKMSSIARHVLSIAFPSSTCYLKLGEHQSQSLVFWCVFGFGCWCSRFDHPDVFPASGFANCDQTVCIKWPCHSSWTIATYWEFWWWFIYSSSWRAGQLSYICASAYPSGLIYIWLLGSCKCHLLTRCVLAWVSGFPTCCHWICRHICFSTRANTQVHACNCSQGQWCRWQMKAGKWIFEQWFVSFHLHSWNRWWGVLGLLAFPVGKILCPRSVGTNVFVLGGWLIGQLSQRTLTGSLLKHLSKLQVCTS